MKIDNVSIQNMWSCGDEPVVFKEFGNHSLIIGKNNVGKSMVLKATRFASEHAMQISQAQPIPVPNEWYFDTKGQQPPENPMFSVMVDVGESVVTGTKNQLRKQFEKAVANSEILDDLSTSKINLIIKSVSNGQIQGTANLVDVPPFDDSRYARFGLSANQQTHEQHRQILINHMRNHFLHSFGSSVDYIGGWRSLHDNVSGNQNMIHNLHLWLAPSQTEKLRVRTFHRIESLFCDLMRRTDLALHPENNGKNLHIMIGDRYLPVESLGDGVRHLLMAAYHLVVHPESILLIEEPETHLHPEMQRHLMTVLRRESRGQSITTTHSPVLLDAGTHANVYRVEHDGNYSTVKSCATPTDFHGILDLLDVRASDILQANVVIWVEGPTDRMFIKRCFGLRGDELEEGVDYQIVFYGGRLRSHLTFDDLPELVDLMKLSRHVAMVCDSDRSSQTDELDASKSRLKKECEDMNGFYWVTDGREIENYFSNSVLTRTYKELLPESDLQISLPQFEKLATVLEKIMPAPARGDGWKINYEDNKARVMPELLKRLAKDDLTHLNLNAQLDKLVARIRQASPQFST